jgi:hypothetical protein
LHGSGHLFRRERPAEERRRAHRREQVFADARDAYAIRFRAAGKVARPRAGVAGDLLAGLALCPPGEEVRAEDPRDLLVLSEGADHRQPVGRWKRQRLEEHGIDDAEERSRCTDAERGREEDGQRDGGIAAKPAQREADVLRQIVDEMEALRFAAALLPHFGIAELEPGAPRRLVASQPRLHQVRCSRLEVEAQLVVHLLLEPVSAPPRRCQRSQS